MWTLETMIEVRRRKQIGINVPTWLRPERATQYIKRKLGVSFAMEIIILGCWSFF
jgi:hypothetical protein